MRLFMLLVGVSLLAGCSAKTPQCADEQVLTRVKQLAENAVRETLAQRDPEVNASSVLSRINFALNSVSATAHDKGIDKWTCAGELRVSLPPEIAALKDHHVFKVVAIPKLEVGFQGDDIVVPLTYTVYQSQEKKELRVNAEGQDIPAKYIQGAYRVGAFTSDLRKLPDLHAGLALYNAKSKHLLIEPTKEGKLQFHVTYDNTLCRPWTQNITSEHDDTLVYDNPAVGCSATFSRLGEILLVEHTGCALMIETCLPDGVYRKQ